MKPLQPSGSLLAQFDPRLPAQFFAQEQVISAAELRREYLARGQSARAAESALRYHAAAGNILQVRRGLYVTRLALVDPYLLAARAAPDAVIAYGGALSFHGLTGLGHQIEYLTATQASRFDFGEVIYQPVRHLDAASEGELRPRRGVDLRVWGIERALVGVLQQQRLGPPMHEVALLIMRHPLDDERLVWEAIHLGAPAVFARLGYLLEWRTGSRSPLMERAARLPRDPVPLVTALPWNEGPPEPSTTNHRWRLKVPIALERALEAAWRTPVSRAWPLR